MRRWFTTPRSTSHCLITAQVRGTVEGWSMGRREAARSAVSGKFLARAPSGGCAGRRADSTAPMTEGGAGSESLPLDRRPARGLPMAGQPGIMSSIAEADSMRSGTPTSRGLGDGCLCRALEQTATADPRPVSGSSSGLSLVSSAGSWRRGRQRTQRAAAASADPSTRMSYPGGLPRREQNPTETSYVGSLSDPHDQQQREHGLNDPANAGRWPPHGCPLLTHRDDLLIWRSRRAPADRRNRVGRRWPGHLAS
jgi:hypothetical protein